MSALDRHFAGFISYNHDDNAKPGRDWAGWVQTHLQSYRTPEELVGQTSIYGDPVPASMPHVFRDKTQLPGTGDLDSMLKEALSRSRVLIVLCSPAAARSPWVDQEVRYFKQLGRPKQIVALVLQGRPHSGEAITECYPPSLAYELDAEGTPDKSKLAHPIFIDLRPEDAEVGATSPEAHRELLRQMGKLREDYIEVAVNAYAARLENARIMLLSGTLGLYTPELTQREVLRQIEEQKQRELEIASKLSSARRRTRIALLACAIVAALLIGSVVATNRAVQAERRAEDATQQALTSEAALAKIVRSAFDFVDWDSGVPPAKAEPVLREMLGYYRNFPPADNDPLKLAFFSSTLNRLGDICTGNEKDPNADLSKPDVGRLREALDLFEEAVDVNERALAGNPDDEAALASLASSLSRAGTIHRLFAVDLQGEAQDEEFQEALECFRRSVSISTQQVALSGASPSKVADWNSAAATHLIGEAKTYDELAKAHAGDPSAWKLHTEAAIEARSRGVAAYESAIGAAQGTEEHKNSIEDWRKEMEAERLILANPPARPAGG